LLVKRRAQLEALDQFYAVLGLNYFRSEQPPSINRQGRWWFNRTGQAALRVFTDTIRERDVMGWFIAHGVFYGIYLTLANDRQNDALLPVIKRFVGRYLKDVQKLFEG